MMIGPNTGKLDWLDITEYYNFIPFFANRYNKLLEGCVEAIKLILTY